ncbi:GntR family transcriptional regulator [Thioalkalivibrio sp. XN8]|uniref:GntR family transcriptional regulator n=1 Tax=Thioalkalivibrio sp. XN8 TaxID=2712863 RepID=UPI0013EA59B9|nr:GntR family transcriptional regulator [Thioalkalivibrio sp. XN8]NGP52872.1 GntR family transcriptional regulator [Thioalkalivibrio sp. XN8]
MAIQRSNLRDQVREELLDWLADGRLPPGQRLEEERISRALGVSRTPLREALTSLASDGLVEAIPRRGFRVPKLSAERVRNLHPVVGALEGLAVRLSGPQAPQLASQLEALNERLGSVHLSPMQRADLDRRWHQTLVSRNPNRELGQLLERVRARLRPYAGSWERSARDVEQARSEHAEIARLLARGEVDQAAEAVLRHWVGGIRVVTAWIQGGHAA